MMLHTRHSKHFKCLVKYTISQGEALLASSLDKKFENFKQFEGSE